MDFLINCLILINVMLAIAWVVLGMARMDRRYAANVRSEHDRKSILRGQKPPRR